MHKPHGKAISPAFGTQIDLARGVLCWYTSRPRARIEVRGGATRNATARARSGAGAGASAPKSLASAIDASSTGAAGALSVAAGASVRKVASAASSSSENSDWKSSSILLTDRRMPQKTDGDGRADGRTDDFALLVTALSLPRPRPHTCTRAHHTTHPMSPLTPHTVPPLSLSLSVSPLSRCSLAHIWRALRFVTRQSIHTDDAQPT